MVQVRKGNKMTNYKQKDAQRGCYKAEGSVAGGANSSYCQFRKYSRVTNLFEF